MNELFSAYLLFIKLMWRFDITMDDRMSYMEFKRYEQKIKRQSIKDNQ